MGVGVLGPLTVDGSAAVVGRRDRVVLSALALHPGVAVSAERLADAIWGPEPPASSSKIVQGCVVRLRRTIGTASIETTPQGYRMVLPRDEVDTQQFDRLVRRGRELLTLGEPDRASYVVGQALQLWRGPPFLELEGWDDGRAEAARLEQLHLDAEELGLDAALRSGHYREVLAEAQALVARAPLRERRWALLALAEYQAGQQAEALRTLRRARTMLADELGLDPSPDMIALEQAILRQEPSLLSEVAPAGLSDTCPYRGLVPYDVGDADAFFGRDDEVASCLRRLADSGSLTVTGPSGCGKSSLVRAGIAASLQRDGHRVVIITPGVRPLEALTAVPTTGPPPCLVVDQCEEAVTLCDNEAERAGFFAAIAAHALRAPVVVALRADRLGALTTHPEFARLIEQGLYLVRPLGESDLRAAIERPAQQHGLLLEAGLVDLLVREAEGEPGALPLLSHALSQTWALREGRTLTVAGYQETGGIRGAVARSAEQVYAEVSPEQRQVLRDLLLRLVTPMSDGEPLRSRVPLRVVAGSVEHERVIELLVAARLLTSDDGVVELSHEALASAWPRLRTWLDDDVQGQRILRHLSVAADSWQTMDRPDSELYRGVRLTQAVQWADGVDPDLNAAERAFLAASRQHAAAEQATAERNVRRQARANRRLRGLLAGVGLLLVVALVAGHLAVRAADRADAEALRADARRLGALALLAEDPDKSLLLAVQGVRLDDSADTRTNLLAALSRTPELIGSTRADTALFSLDVAPDGNRVAIGHTWGRVDLVDPGTHELLGTYDDVRAAANFDFSPDGRQLVIGTQPHPNDPSPDAQPLRLVDAATLRDAPVQLRGSPPRSFAFHAHYSADGRTRAAVAVLPSTGNADLPAETAMVWDLARPEQPVMRVDLPGWDTHIALSPDGATLYAGTADPPSVTAFDVASGRPILQAPVEGGALALSLDGSVLGAAAGPEIAVLDARTLQERTRLQGHAADVSVLDFSPDGRRLASGSVDHSAIVWDLGTGAVERELRGHTGEVTGVGFSPDGRTLTTTSLDERVMQWDLVGDRRFAARVGPPGDLPPGLGYAFASAGAVAYVYHEMPSAPGEPAAALLLRDLGTGVLSEPLDTGHGGWGSFSWHPEGERFATAGSDGYVRVWDRVTRALLVERRVATSPPMGLDHSDDGTLLLLAEEDGSITLLDAETLRSLGPTTRSLEPLSEPTSVAVVGAALSPDGRTALVMTSDRRFSTVDLEEGRVLHRGGLGGEDLPPGSVDFSPDGRFAVVTSGRSRVFDVERREWAGPAAQVHRGLVTSAAYAPDGSTVATGGDDGTVTLSDGRTGAVLATLQPGAASVWMFVSWLPDGRTLLIASSDGAVHTWVTAAERWIAFACGAAGRDLTEQEWRDALDDRPYAETCPD